ncbi:MAG TPA: hypothetical protein VMW94_04365, partial [Actinomycetes bacterium]|nr:hypothetical protein [Actinomycetes bacterium]
DEHLPAISDRVQDILAGDDIPLIADQFAYPAPEVSADLGAEAQQIMQDELLASLDAQEPAQESPAPSQAQAVASKLAALSAIPAAPVKVMPEEPAPPRFEVPPADRRASYMLAEVFRSIATA